MFWGVLAALVIGMPMSAYGNLANVTEWKVAGSLAVLVISGAVCASLTALERHRERPQIPSHVDSFQDA
jgi:predicted MFS family arabinose efflux permease